MMAGREKPDVSVLNSEQQEKLRQFKIKTRIDNERYLRSHPEVDVLIGGFLRDVLHKRPADVREFAADHFTNPDLQAAVVSKMQENSGLE
ncbi:RIIa domain-containing protein 1 [Salarias fasciatus]|uniref:RIIa domain-containing protein 1 n=1 Tax=Salarias fasciatus TaxID=181472 RepID=UPI001176FE86|nr:RIIa domain-containing protein 1 [Salarias fasciatus]